MSVESQPERLPVDLSLQLEAAGLDYNANYFLGRGVYSDTEITEALRVGHIVAFPLIEEHINGSSFDVTLGHWFYTTDNQRRTSYNPFNESDVGRYFGERALRADPHLHICEKFGFEPHKNIPDDHPVIPVFGKERILAHTHEFIGIRGPGTTEMRGRSTVGRNGIYTCVDAGWGDPGFINRWTMEIYNSNSEPILLPVGERVAQIIFHGTGPVRSSYEQRGKYQANEHLADLIRNWTPEQMLPRSYKDERKLPLPAGVEIELRPQ